MEHIITTIVITSIPGNAETTEPVAMRIFLAGITVVASPLVTVTSL